MTLQRVKSWVYDLILWLVRNKRNSIRPNTLLLIRTNNIGDYILWRNILPEIRKSEKFKDHHITLLGNKAWKNLFENFDSELVDDVIWMDYTEFKKNMPYRYRLLKQVRAKGFETVINTLSSRCKRIDDAFTLVCTNSHTIGQSTDHTNIFDYEVGYDLNLFDDFFNDAIPFEFEFFRTKRFTEYFLKQSIPESTVPSFEKINIPLPAVLSGKDYFVIFPGSSTPSRIWKAENFAKVAAFVVANYQLTPVICGAPSDQPYVDAFLQAYKNECINLCGQTSLTDLVGVARNAKLFVSIDTGGAHIAAVAGCPLVGIFNGSHYGRYNPYPAEIYPNVHGVYPDKVENALKMERIDEKYNKIIEQDYNDITPEKICRTIAEIFTKQGSPVSQENI